MPCSELVPGKKYKIGNYGNPKYAGLIVIFSHIGIGNVAIVKPVPGQNVDYDFGVPIKELVPWTEEISSEPVVPPSSSPSSLPWLDPLRRMWAVILGLLWTPLLSSIFL
jgi:hypothetical protein